jgi:hypothetical protein
MYKLIYLYTIIATLFITRANAQLNFTLERTQTVSGTKLYVDNLQNVYVINDNEIFKYKPDGKLFNRYSNKSLGKVTLIDVSNPLKMLLFYKDFSRIVYLDNTLTENGSAVFLDENDLELATLACSSYDNGLWVYTTQNFRLVRFRQDLTTSVDVKNINNFVNFGIQPNYLIEREGQVYMNDSTLGVVVFDIFGTYYKTVPIKGLDKIEVSNNKIFYLKGDKLGVYDMKTFEDFEITLPSTGKAIDFNINENKLYVLKDGKLEVYKIE